MSIESNQWIDTKKRYILFAIVCLSYLTNGLDLSLVGPAVKDLAALIDTDEENVLYGFTIKSFSNGVGCLIACYSFSKFSRQLQFTLSIFIYGLSTLLLPYLANVSQYFFCSFLLGLSNAYIDISTNLFVLELFQNHRLNFHVQTVHFSLSIGQTLGPIFLGPFLAASKADNSSSLNETGLILVQQNATLLNQQIAEITEIQVPFTIGGSLYVLCALAMIICWIYKPYKPPHRTVDGKDLDTAKQISKNDDELVLPSRTFYVIFVFLVICLNAFELTMEYMFLYFISIYLENYLGIKGQSNTNLIALIGIAYIIGRGLNVLISAFKISVNYILYLNILFLFAGSILIFIITPSHDNLILLISIALFLIGLGYSSSLPGMYVFIEKRINITTTLNSFMICIQTAFFCIESYRLGSKITSNSESFKLMNLYYTIGFAVCFVALHLTDLIKKKFLTIKKVT